MATNDQPVVTVSQRLWSDEVGIAEAESVVLPQDPGYEFSNGRKFVTPKDPYAPHD